MVLGNGASTHEFCRDTTQLTALPSSRQKIISVFPRRCMTCARARGGGWPLDSEARLTTSKVRAADALHGQWFFLLSWKGSRLSCLFRDHRDLKDGCGHCFPVAASPEGYRCWAGIKTKPNPTPLPGLIMNSVLAASRSTEHYAGKPSLSLP